MRSRHVYGYVGHRTVRGWVEPQALHLVTALAREQSRRGVTGGVAEIGVHHGRLFLALVLGAPEEPAVAIDLFGDQDHNLDGSIRGDQLAAFERNLRRHASGSSVQTVAADSTTLTGASLRELAGGPVRLISVDGGHSRAMVAQDLQTAADALSPGGVIVGDDVYNYGWPGVVEGTLDFLDATPEVVPFAVGFNKVLFTQRPFAEGYRGFVESLAAARWWDTATRELRGAPVVVLSAAPSSRARIAVRRVRGLWGR